MLVKNMLRFPVIIRAVNRGNVNCPAPVISIQKQQHYATKSKSSSSSSSSSDDEKKPKPPPKQKSQEALKKLNMLLKQMVEEDVTKSQSKLDFAKAKNHRQAGKKDAKTDVEKTAPEGIQLEKAESVRTEPVEKKIITAVKDVAESIGGNIKQTESELLSKLLGSSKEGTLDDKTKTRSLSDIVMGMKIDRKTKASEYQSRAEQVRDIQKTVKYSREEDFRKPRGKSQRRSMPDMRHDSQYPIESINLFGEKPLGIFTTSPIETSSINDSEINKTWKSLYQRDLRLAVTHPPSNYFQQMILWTEQGKIWKFPIDNEQGLEEEQAVYFADHVFLEKHLEPWCPQKGPLRHFMELVCVGLSKNPYMSVKQKQEHIEWYRDYFNDKATILREVGALPVEKRI